MNDYEAIRRLIALYGQLLDTGRFEEWGALFTEDATFTVYGRTYTGRKEIVDEIGGMQTDPPGKHVVLQPVIDLDDENHARAWTDLTAFRCTKEGVFSIAIAGRYHDRLVKGDDRWRIQERTLVMGGEAVPGGTDPSPGV
jgi:uncharacterized protein (TIGR02246 family)